jgi:hypothetical protein
MKISDFTQLYLSKKDNSGMLHQAVQVKVLPESWRKHFKNQIEKVVHQIFGLVVSPSYSFKEYSKNQIRKLQKHPE